MEDNKTQEQVQTRGQRGEVGVASASLTLKTRYASEGRGISLKQFARKLAKEGDAVAKEWFANKSGAKNQKRTDSNINTAKAAGAATKMERRKAKK